MRDGNALALLVQWRRTAFLVAGSALIGSVFLKGLAWFTPFSPPGPLVALFAIPGLLVAFVGLAGLYPTLAERQPTLAHSGGGVVAITAIGVIALFGWVVGKTVLSTVGVKGIESPPTVVFLALVGALAIGFAMFGIASLRSGTPSVTVGALLVGFASTWAALVVVGVVFGSDTPTGLYVVVYGAQPLLLLATGRMLRVDATHSGRDALTDGVVAD